jgi:selenide,water dikinase
MTDPESIRLTQFAKRAGCAAKQPPDYLLSLLAGLPPIEDPNVLVGHATSDDAAVYRISDELALILTTDFFTPIVDSPYDFGAVAAANALSDVYAMAGTPLTALSIVGFPSAALPPEVLVEILRGAGDKAREAGIAIVGGHTIQSDEPIFGLAVVGKVHPDQVIANAGALPGDFLVLSKPLGLGIITTAAKRNEDHLGGIREALDVMTTLNRDASVVMAAGGAHALTDITGFGLLGHLRNVTTASGVSATIWSDLVPILPAAREYVQAGVSPGGTHANRRFLSRWVDYDRAIPEWQQLLLCDAQTSGGLLGAIPGTHAAEVVRHLRYHGLESATIVGCIEAGESGRIRVRTAPESAIDESAR